MKTANDNPINDSSTVHAHIDVFSFEEGTDKTFAVDCKVNSDQVVKWLVSEVEHEASMLRNYGEHSSDTLANAKTREAVIHSKIRMITTLTGDHPHHHRLTYTLRVDALCAAKKAQETIRSRRR